MTATPLEEVDVVDVVVVGGGIVGLSIGWRAAAAGRSVVVCDPAPGGGASRAAAGMLAPVSEARAAEGPLARLGLASLRRWPRFADELVADAGLAGTEDLGLRREGTLQVAFDDDDRRALEELAGVHRELGLDSELLAARRCRELVPLLSPMVRAGLLVPGDWQVDPRRVLRALVGALGARGGELRVEGVRAVRATAGGELWGVELDDATRLEAAAVVLAPGVGVDRIGGVVADLHLPVRPVKGEILRLRAAPGEEVLPMTVRASVKGQPVYLVPRLDGEVVVGATMQEAGADTAVRAGGVLELLRAAIELVPGLGELALEETLAAARPTTPDNGPLLGPTSLAGLHVAAGHYRGGVLLAPVSADAVLAGLGAGEMPVEAGPFDAGRYS